MSLLSSYVPPFYTTFNGVTDYSKGWIAVKRPDFPATKRVFESKAVPGLGVVTLDQGYADKRELDVEYAFRLEDPAQFGAMCRAVEAMYLGVYGKTLVLSDDTSQSYTVAYCEIEKFTRETRTKGTFTIKYFVNTWVDGTGNLTGS